MTENMRTGSKHMVTRPLTALHCLTYLGTLWEHWLSCQSVLYTKKRWLHDFWAYPSLSTQYLALGLKNDVDAMISEHTKMHKCQQSNFPIHSARFFAFPLGSDAAARALSLRICLIQGLSKVGYGLTTKNK